MALSRSQASAIVLADIGEVLGSPVWTVLATLFGALAIGVTIWLSRRNRTRKDISREISVTELVSVHSAADEAKGRIKIYFDDEQIERVHLVEATFKNIGNVPVMADDFDQAITVDLGEGASPLTVDVTGTTPSDLRAEVGAYKTGAVLAPLLLNPGDSLTLKILARNLRKEPHCHYRIVGIAEMTDAASPLQRKDQKTLLKEAFKDVIDTPITSSITGLAVLGVVALIASLFSPDKKTEDAVTLTGGQELCGEVLETSDKGMVVQGADSGNIRSLEIEEVASVKDNAC